MNKHYLTPNLSYCDIKPHSPLAISFESTTIENVTDQGEIDID